MKKYKAHKSIRYKKDSKFTSPNGDVLTIVEEVETWEKCALVYSKKQRRNIIVWINELGCIIE